MTAAHIALMLGATLAGAALREVLAFNRRSNRDKKFSRSYYWERNKGIILWNLIGSAALLMCSDFIFRIEGVLLEKMGLGADWLPSIAAPTFIAIGYGGGHLVRKLLSKGAKAADLGDVFEQVETSTEVTPDAVKTTTTATTITTQPVTPPTPPTDVGV